MHRRLGTIDSLAALPLEQAMKRTGVGLAACDAGGRLTLLSSVLQEMFGVSFAPVPEEELPCYLNLLTEDGSSPLAHQQIPLVRARRGEYVRDAPMTARRADGRLARLRCNAAPLEDDCGELVGALVLVQDVTGEYDAEHEKEVVQSRVVETINHEFRNPLAALLGHLELIRARAESLPPDLAESVDAIERAGWRLRDLVDAATELVAVGVTPHRY